MADNPFGLNNNLGGSSVFPYYGLNQAYGGLNFNTPNSGMNPLGLNNNLPNSSLFSPIQEPQFLGQALNNSSGYGGTSYGAGSNGTGSNTNGGPSPLSYGGSINAIGTGVGLYEYFKSQQQLNALNKIPYPNYTVSPELRQAYSQASAMSNQGFTPAERGGYINNMNQQNALSYKNALSAGGGNLSNAVSAGINSGNVNAFNQFAINDAQLHRQNMQYAGQLAGQVQNINDMQTQSQIQRRQMQEQQLQGAQTAGAQTFMNSFQGGLGLYPPGSAGGGSGSASTIASLAKILPLLAAV